jgi:hypothetical protein
MHEHERQEALAWIEKRAGALGHTVYRELAEGREPWLHVPVSVKGNKDAYEKAEVLQRLEDEWNAPLSEARPYWKLVLLPAPPPRASDRPVTAAAVGDE